MDYSNQGQVAVGNYAAQAKTAQPETMLESVVSRLSTISSRISRMTDRTAGISNTVIGFQGESTVNPKPAAIASSINDYLNEIENGLNQVEANLGRIS